MIFGIGFVVDIFKDIWTDQLYNFYRIFLTFLSIYRSSVQENVFFLRELSTPTRLQARTNEIICCHAYDLIDFIQEN